MKKLLLLIWVCLLAQCALAAETGVGEGQIVIGQSAALSGPAAQIGIQYNLGAEVYFDALNASGGVAGRKIRLIKLDDKYEASLAAANTHKLIEEDKVFALFGYVGTPTSNAALPVFTEAKVPFFAPYSGADSLRYPFNRYIFNLRASYSDETRYLVDQLVALSINKIAVFYQNDAYGNSGLAGVEHALADHNLKIVGSATVERNSTDVAHAIAELKAKSPDVIIEVAAYASSAALIKGMKQSGYMGQFYNLSFVGSKALADLLDADGPGVVISQVVPNPWKSNIALVRDYQKAMEAAGKKDDINFSSLEGYLAAKVFTEGVRRAGSSLTRESLMNALEGMHPGNFDSGGFDVLFNKQNHSASHFVESTMIVAGKKFRS